MLGLEFPGRLAVFVDGDGSESGGCNVLDQVQAYCWTVCDAKSLGLRLAQVAPSTEIRECADCVCAEDARGCWPVLVVASCRIVERMAERNCGGTVGREEGDRPCGPSSGLQGNETARCELVFDGLDCGDLEWKLHEGALGNGDVEQSSDEPRITQGAPESPVFFTMIMELLLRDLIKSWISRKLAWRLDDFTLAAICYADDVSVSAAETMVSDVIEKLKEVGLTVGAQKTHWTSFPKMMDKNIMVDGSAVVWEEVLEFCGIDGVFGREMQDMRSHTEQLKPTNCRAKWKLVFNSPWLPRFVAVEHHKDHDVAGFPLELECLDDGQGTERQNCELEREWWRMLLE